MQGGFQKGIAIITALFIMTLVAIIATAISLNLLISVTETNSVDDYTKAFFKSDELLSCEALKLIAQAEKDPKKFTLINYSKFESSINTAFTSDLQSKFNLNNLKKKEWQYSFIILLTTVDKSTHEKEATEIVEQIARWLTPLKSGESLSSPFNQNYAKSKTKTLPTHAPFTSASELRLIKGVTAKRFNALAPYITALPEITAINVNTAEIPVLMALGSGLSKNTAKKIIALRKQKKGLTTVNELNKISDFKKAQVPQNMLSFTSNYFLTRIVLSKGTINESTLYNIFLRKVNKKEISIQRLSQTINTL